MAGKRALVVVTTVPADESSLREALPDADEIRVVAPAADVSFLQWLTNDEDDARRRADEAAQRVASAVGGDTKVEIDRTSESTDAAQAIRDALREFQADEIVVVTRAGDDSTWHEEETAYAIAEELGFTDDEVKWTVIPFNQSFRPGPKSFDFDINQISYKPQRAEAVDFSDSYYDVEQAIVTVEGSKIDAAASIADLEDAKLGAQIGTTSLEAINDTIQPSSEPSVYDTNNDAISGLKAKQVDGIVVDFPTALFMAAVQLDNGKVVGRLPAAEGGEYFGVVLEKDSSLTECVNEAIQAIKDDGTLEELEQKWLTGSAPVLE